jgi:HEAT repeat protein
MRDYLKEASDVIFGNKISLASELEAMPDQVVGNLLGVIARARNPMQSMIRKAAAYGLGQIGEPRSIKQLREFFENESADGVRDAMLASMTAIKMAPAPQHTQSERCKIIDDVYHNRKPADWA